MTDYILAGALAALAIIMLWFYKRSRHKLKNIFVGIISGVLLLYPASMAVTAFSRVLNLNLFTFCVSGILGVPGVIVLCVCALI